MSVINKMLKDLESEHTLEVSDKGNILVSQSNTNLIIIIGLIVLSISFVLYFYSEVYNQKINTNFKQELMLEKQQSVEKLELVKVNKKPLKPIEIVNKELDLDATKETLNNATLKRNVVEKIIVKDAKITENLQQDNNKPQIKIEEKLSQNINETPPKVFKITKSKVSPKKQAQRFWNEAEQHPQNAESLLTKALGLNASLHGARLQLIALLVTQKRLGSAEQLTDRGLILSPQHPGYIEWKARMRVAFNDSKTGLQWLLKASPEIEQHINYYGILASLASQLKYNEIAADTYLKLSTIQPKHGPWLLGMAISEERLGNKQTAKEYYQKAQSADGLTPRARIFIQQKLQKLES